MPLPSRDQFTGWDAARQRTHTIKGSPPVVAIAEHGVSFTDWSASGSALRVAPPAAAVRRRTRARTAWAADQLARVLGHAVGRIPCYVCGRRRSPSSRGRPPRCGPGCYAALQSRLVTIGGHDTKTGPAAAALELRACAFGYGVFVRPGHRLRAGAPLGEYLGLVKPWDMDYGRNSAYLFELGPGPQPHALVDAERCGNWTRFVNSHCAPNVAVRNTQAGGRAMVLFEAARDLAAGEQVLVCYGRQYFASGLQGPCRCDHVEGPHLPPP
ncbi:hypothetical protein P8C59_003413 [Phyllachora maydis]|uniref:SET domain-containing protein n=1 Tax=Phyllachora maydis TaxID=1825666 RepID=A0AAD9MAB7_9PEZI|nr:hypothetical protein P8C59_003413 [Phyllachora maydis]